MEDTRSVNDSRYVIVSACRNESDYIGGLIDTISAQTLKPFQWVIVDDGSTDDTYSIAATKGASLSFLKVVKMPNSGLRSFASQVYAQQYGVELLKTFDYEFIGFLDADIELEKDYYKKLIEFFSANPNMGLLGGILIDQYKNRTGNIRKGSEDYHIPGGIQLFRRQCFEQIGGYVPVEGGGQDTIADTMSMMHGWKILSTDKANALHLRPDGFSKHSVFRQGLVFGRRCYSIGYHPLFFLGQCLRRAFYRPILIGSFCKLIGFIVASVKAEPRPVSEEVVRFLRKIQLHRLRRRITLKSSLKD